MEARRLFAQQQNRRKWGEWLPEPRWRWAPELGPVGPADSTDGRSLLGEGIPRRAEGLQAQW